MVQRKQDGLDRFIERLRSDLSDPGRREAACAKLNRPCTTARDGLHKSADLI